jgi:hypothetical protein
MRVCTVASAESTAEALVEALAPVVQGPVEWTLERRRQGRKEWIVRFPYL